ncbi:hypothetical protein AB1Y20_018340 [Prymnesium parvum]|uniref:Uncharacterized protein n=1 Tax=Prymnesium parvum TaxID=97485 RepID=A0AB34JNH3_PRYPA
MAASPACHIWHGERPDGRLGFMYALIVATLRASCATSVRSVRSQSLAHAANASALLPAALALRRGDLFVWVGPKQHAAPPWALLRARGVVRLYYNTEPLPYGCLVPPLRRPLRRALPSPPLVDEVLDYSLANIETCAARADAPPLRHLPPGWGEGWGEGGMPPPPRGAARAAQALFLGDVRLEERAACFAGLRALVRPVNDVWNRTAFAALFSRGVTVVVNVHKRCLQEERTQPFEAVRAAQVLSAGGILVSQRAHPRDEAAYAGLVDFHPLAQLPRAIEQLLATPHLSRLAASRAREFALRFAPAASFHAAAVPRAGGAAACTRTLPHAVCCRHPDARPPVSQRIMQCRR